MFRDVKGKINFIWLFLLLVPVFINLDVSTGLNFSADPFNHTGSPSLPISYFVIVIFAVLGVFRFVINLQVLLFTVLSIMALVEITHGLSRQVHTLLGMTVPFFLMHLLEKRDWRSDFFLDRLRVVIYFIVFIKFITDIAFGRGVSGNSFIFERVVIYNYYDYFPVFYSLVACLCVHSILRGERKVSSFLIFIICMMFVFGSHSRLATLLFFLIPFNIILSGLPLSRSVFLAYAFLLLLFNIALTYLIPVFVHGMDLESSMSIRFDHWRNFWGDFSIFNLVLPTLNEYRQSLNWGSLHNEPLEIFSYFGVFGLIYYALLFWLLAVTSYRFLSFSILTLCMFGGFFQLNISNPYLSVILGLFLFSLQSKSRDVEPKNSTGLLRLE